MCRLNWEICEAILVGFFQLAKARPELPRWKWQTPTLQSTKLQLSGLHGERQVALDPASDVRQSHHNNASQQATQHQ